MKKLAILVFLPVFLMVAFTLLPTGMSKSDVVEGYLSTTSFAASSAASLQYLTQFHTVRTVQYDAKFADSIGEHIAALAADLCEDFGNGGNTSYSAAQGRRVGQFRYSTKQTTGYATSAQLTESLAKLRKDPTATSFISCCGFATYCWDVLLSGHSPYGTSCTATVSANFQDIIEGDGTTQYIIDHAKPGDLLFYTKASGATPPLAVNGIYKHVEVYLGAYSGTDAEGSPYRIEYACAGSNQPTKRRDACIKPLETTTSGSSHPYVFLVSLEKWIVSGHSPTDNSGQAEFVDELI